MKWSLGRSGRRWREINLKKEIGRRKGLPISGLRYLTYLPGRYLTYLPYLSWPLTSSFHFLPHFTLPHLTLPHLTFSFANELPRHSTFPRRRHRIAHWKEFMPTRERWLLDKTSKERKRRSCLMVMNNSGSWTAVTAKRFRHAQCEFGRYGLFYTLAASIATCCSRILSAVVVLLWDEGGGTQAYAFHNLNSSGWPCLPQ